jgi:hypothetical protein
VLELGKGKGADYDRSKAAMKIMLITTPFVELANAKLQSSLLSIAIEKPHIFDKFQIMTVYLNACCRHALPYMNPRGKRKKGP